MDRPTTFIGYTQYRDTVGQALVQTTEDFVYIGFLLRQAKEDPVILSGSPYDNYKDFARQEFNLEESTVSRLININERFGNGAELLPQYKGFDRTKLQEMLTLPPAIADQLTPDMTREEIRDLKADIKEGEKTTPIERYMERSELTEADGDALYRFCFEFFRDHKSAWLSFKGWNKDIEDMSDILFPNGEGIIRATVKGEGPCMIKSRGTDEELILTYMADGNRKESITWEQLADAVEKVGENNKGFTERSYNTAYEIAPAQTKKVEKPAKDTKIKSSQGVGQEPEPEPNTDEAAENVASVENDKIDNDGENVVEHSNLQGSEAIEPLKGEVEDIPDDENIKYDRTEVERIERRIETLRIWVGRIKSDGESTGAWSTIEHAGISIQNIAHAQYEEVRNGRDS